MEYPSWKELIKMEKLFGQEVDGQLTKKVKGLSNGHQIAAIAFKTSLHVLPPPFDAMAESIYESVDGYDKEKLSEVKKFLHTIKRQGKDRYNELAPKLSRITCDIINLKNETARQSTLLYVTDIIISKADTMDQKIHKITKIQEELTYFQS